MEIIMKQLFFYAIALLFVIACSTQKGIVKIEQENDLAEEEDSVEYELIVFDPKFETWYILQNSPANYRSQQYYEYWNRQYVTAWNYHASNSRRSSFFEPIIGWDPTIDYGFEINHKLFYYFQYVERVLKIEIIPNGPRSLAF